MYFIDIIIFESNDVSGHTFPTLFVSQATKRVSCLVPEEYFDFKLVYFLYIYCNVRTYNGQRFFCPV